MVFQAKTQAKILSIELGPRSIFFDNSASASARGTPNPESYPRESTFTNPSSVKRLSIAGEMPHNSAGQHGRGREMAGQGRLGFNFNMIWLLIFTKAL